MSKENVFLVLTSAIGIRGEVIPAGKLIEVPDAAAKDLLRRGKARLATEADGTPSAGDDDGAADEAAAAAALEAATARAMKDHELDAEAWAALSDKKRAALLKAAADAIAKDAAE